MKISLKTIWQPLKDCIRDLINWILEVVLSSKEQNFTTSKNKKKEKSNNMPIFHYNFEISSIIE